MLVCLQRYVSTGISSFCRSKRTGRTFAGMHGAPYCLERVAEDMSILRNCKPRVHYQLCIALQSMWFCSPVTSLYIISTLIKNKTQRHGLQHPLWQSRCQKSVLAVSPLDKEKGSQAATGVGLDDWKEQNLCNYPSWILYCYSILEMEGEVRRGIVTKIQNILRWLCEDWQP